MRRARLLLATTTIAAIAIAIAMTSATARATAFAQPRRERLASPSDAAWVVANQGGAVALRGDRALVGATTSTAGGLVNAGLATLYRRGDDGWTALSTLPGEAAAQLFGNAVALGDEWRAITALGSAAVHLVPETGDDAWAPATIVTPVGPATNFGLALAIAETSLLVGAPGVSSDIGRVFTYRYKEASGTWTPEATFTAPVPAVADVFGQVIAVDGDLALVGAAGTAPGGAVYQMTRAGPESPWVLDPAPILPALPELERFGRAIAVAGDLLAIGAPRSLADQGRVVVYQRIGEAWTAITVLEPPAEATAQYLEISFGESLAIAEGALLVGAPGAGTGAIYLFNEPLLGGPPSVIISDPSDPAVDQFGARMAIDGRRVAVGAPGTGVAAVPGDAYVLDLQVAVGEPCEAPTDCASTFCVDGLCCDQVCDDPCVACSVAGGGGLDGACTPMLCPEGEWCVADRCVDQGGTSSTSEGGPGTDDSSGAGTASSGAESDSATGGIPGLVLDPIAGSGCACRAQAGDPGPRAGGAAFGLLALGLLALRRRPRR